MVSFFGDYDTTETVIIPFNTFTSDDPSASATITNLAAGDIEIHKDGSTTQRSSDAGVTVTIDFDTVTGNHIASIDLSDNTDAGYYSAGSRYQVRMEGTTVDGATINAWIGAFSIGCVLRPTTDGNTLDVTSTGAAGIDWGNVENPTTAVDLSGTDIQLCDTVTTLTGHTAQTGDTYALANGATGFAAIDTVVDTILVDTADMQPRVAAIETDTNELQGDWTNGGRLDLIIDAILVDTGTTLPATLSTIDTVVDSNATALAALNDISVADVLTTQMTESYAADGTAPTIAQALCFLISATTEFAISGTTITAKKLDGSTTAATFTIDDDTTPTSRTRAT